jgi:hypothetical protein
MVLMPENVGPSVAAWVLLVAAYHFYYGRAGVRTGQLARAVSRSLFLDNRVHPRQNAELPPPRNRWPLAPWFVRGLVKRGASAATLLILAVVAAAAVRSPGLSSALMSLCILSALEMLVFWTITAPEW